MLTLSASLVRVKASRRQELFQLSEVQLDFVVARRNDCPAGMDGCPSSAACRAEGEVMKLALARFGKSVL